MSSQPLPARTRRVGRYRSPLRALFIATVVLIGCRPDTPEVAPPGDTVPAAPAPVATETPTVTDTARRQNPDGGSGYWTAGPSTQESALEKEKREVLATLGTFFTTVETGSEEQFKRQLAARSLELLKAYDAESSVWPIAKEALGSLGNRRIRFLGGVPDSAALLVSGERTTGDTALPGAIVLSVLRENGEWKVMYPGAQPYEEHVGP
jgi:hypothetical protein